jgi:hypothetical protein
MVAFLLSTRFVGCVIGGAVLGYHYAYTDVGFLFPNRRRLLGAPSTGHGH